MSNNNNISDKESGLRTNNEGLTPKQELLPSPLSQLQEQEVIIQKGLNGFIKAGEALKVIKEGKLYSGEYATYQEYCQKKWNFTPQHANRLIKAATVVEEIKSEPIGSIVPQSEAQARALSKSENPAVDWKETQEVTGKEQPTAKELAALIKEKNKKKDFIDAEIAEETHEEIPCEAISDASEETEQASITLLLKDIINTPYKKGVSTGRSQINVEADDDSVERLVRLKKLLCRSRSSVVLQALIFMEVALESISDTSLPKG